MFGGLGLGLVPKREISGVMVTTLQVRVDHDLMARLDAVCEETGRSRSDVTRLLLIAALDMHESEKKGGKR